MVHFCSERYLGWLERIVGWEINVEEEHALVIGGVLWSHNRRLPVELITLVSGARGAVRGWISTEVNKFFLNSF